MNRDHSVVFEIAFKYRISDSSVDYDGYSISSKGFLPTVVDIMVIWVKFTHSSPFHFADSENADIHSCHLLFDHFQFALIHGPNITGSYAILRFTASDFTSITSHVHKWVLFFLWLHLFILPGVISPLICSMSYLFAFSYCSWGSQGKNTGMVCHSLLQWTMFGQTFGQRWRSSIQLAKQDQELTVVQIMNSLLPSSDWNWRK